MVTWGELTTAEQGGLRKISLGENINADLWSLLDKKGLVGVLYNDFLTAAGREVLAQATPQPQPATAPTAGGAGEAEIRSQFNAYQKAIDYRHILKSFYANQEIKAAKNELVECAEDKIRTLLATADTLRAENAKLVSELAAVRVERDAMRALVEACDQMLTLDCLPANKPTLRRYETASEYGHEVAEWEIANAMYEALAEFHRVTGGQS